MPHSLRSAPGLETPAARACTQVRSTVVVSSLQVLRDAGHEARYAALVAPDVRDRLFALGAPVWLPIAIADAHYAACDALRLSEEEIQAIGARLAPVHASGVGVILRVARAGGVTPWAVLTKAPRYWERMYQGGLVTVHEDGPKDARLVLTGQPLARYAYWTTGFAGIVRSLAQALSSRAYVSVRTAPQRDGATFAVSWA